jgi:hypothetical protein
MKRTILAVILGLVMLAGTSAFAQKPVRNVSPKKHPNIAAAQKFCQKAFDCTVKAQKANEFDLGGHAQKAKDLLEQASAELKLAAEVSNANQGK